MENTETCGSYLLMVGSSCDTNSNSEVLINGTRNNSIVLQPWDLLDEGNNSSVYLNITLFDEDGEPCLFLERFQLNPESELYIVVGFVVIIII